ncbi:hypothetical protein [Micromonospora craniellae]|uniref:DUF3558 domain-containing protein n=1 Tax=Micromonospora craniellae TaxID=2294034 RepID=A0A372FR26_9ACTN|nr:hypothetical protein [Micromonospora craniellae]QOC90873.1 hypothetical protein ID554_22730 [Micromonospora craniellae]RFS41564.1 hypothetical protein D0Q02_29435 [Micromonospora craniellae]
MTRDDEDIRRLFTDAVPPLPAPRDRIAEVGTRVRRHRRRVVTTTAAAVTLIVALGVALPTLRGPDRTTPPVTATDPAGEVVCPTSIAGRPDLDAVRYGDDEPLVPPGAVEIINCQVQVDNLHSAPEIPGPRALTTGVDEIVRMLNAQPSRPTDGRGRPYADGELRCTAAAQQEQTVLVLRYADREPVTVWTDSNCRVAVTATHGRGVDFGIFSTFLDRYREQLVATTDPATITTPACPATIPAERMSDSKPPDRIRFHHSDPYPILPTPLIEVAACRYEVNDDTAELVRQEQRRADADDLRPILNETFDRSATRSDCGGWPDWRGHPLPTTFDTLTVADATGATAEFWVRHSPCRNARHLFANNQATPLLLDALTGMLGRPPGR